MSNNDIYFCIHMYVYMHIYIYIYTTSYVLSFFCFENVANYLLLFAHPLCCHSHLFLVFYCQALLIPTRQCSWTTLRFYW